MRVGANGVELDVRLACDQVPVVIHDATLNRTGMKPGLISKLSSEELQQVDVGTWFDRRLKTAAKSYAGERVPTLRQVFDLFSDIPGSIYIELKIRAGEGPILAANVINLIREYSMYHRAVLASFDLQTLEAARTIENGIRTAALFQPRKIARLPFLKSTSIVDLASSFGADEIALHHTLARKPITDRAIDRGMKIVVWTVDDPVWIARSRTLGIKALITNDPARMLHHRDMATTD